MHNVKAVKSIGGCLSNTILEHIIHYELSYLRQWFDMKLHYKLSWLYFIYYRNQVYSFKKVAFN